ncbi:MAG: hypothetical protein IKT52_13360 [Oscillospiraceae bacterium]|nr:hypothetical protein [Oscillospiraceae bacterium]
MKNMKRLVSLLLVLCLTMALAACGGNKLEVATQPATEPVMQETNPVEENKDPLAFEAGTVLRMATGYNSAKTGLFFDAETAGEGITLADGKTYQTGDLKPTWVEVQDVLGMKFENLYQGNSASNEFKYWQDRLNEVDMVSGTAAQLSEFGEAGSLVNLAEHLDKMPNFKAYLEENAIVRLSVTGNVDNGAIYFSPYFDGVNDIERMPLMRVDWAVKLLDGEGEFTAEKSGTTAAAVYEPYMPTSGKVVVDVVKADGSAVEQVTKDYDAAGNIVALMNEKGAMSGVEAVNMLRTYIDTAYNGYYGTTRSDLFVGQNAAWDADEMVALLRCVVANAQTLNGTDTIQGLFSREDNNNQRRVDLFRFAGVLFGVRGLESRQDYLYVGTDGKLHDARQEAETYAAIEKMNDMVAEGLISKSFVDGSKESSSTMLENDMGFMSYDYNQTQTILNETKLQEGEKYMAVMVPVAKWNDGEEKYMRFTESWRSVKTDGWGISVAGVAGDENKLNAALALIDYAYSPEGQILMSYGPSAFIKEGETFNFNGKEMPVIADATYAELWEKASGNYTNYARYYLGSTLSFVKSQAFEYQCTHEVGKEGAGYISTAIALGTIKHPELAITENPWYISVPTVLPTTQAENDEIAGLTELKNSYSSSKGDDQVNYFVDQIAGGYVHDGMGSAEEAADYAVNTMNGKLYLYDKQAAYDRLLAYYATIG